MLYELQITGKTITAGLYSQLEHIQQALKQEQSLVNRKGLLFNNDNGRRQVAWVARDIIQRLCWESLFRSPYYLEFGPKDCHVFNSLDKQSWEILRKWGSFELFASKIPVFTARPLQSWSHVGKSFLLSMWMTRGLKLCQISGILFFAYISVLDEGKDILCLLFRDLL